MSEAILLTDGYKLDHRRQYPDGTQIVYSNFTPRSCNYFPEAHEGVVVFGIQYFIKEYLLKQFNKEFFDKPKDVAVKEFSRRVNTFLGPNNVGSNHIAELHDLSFLPLIIKALPEGTLCPIKVPVLTIRNDENYPKFFWLVNYFETLMSCVLWLPMTSATSARLYKKELIRHAKATGWEDGFLGFSCHDFSMRGMAGIEAAIISGMGHLTSFVGSETLPAIAALEEYYNADADKELIASTIPATEHSVMCAGGEEDEFETFKRLITDIYPNGFVSIVSDTWDFWQVMTDYLPRLKKDILSRDGRVVIRPDSGDPVDIICGIEDSNIQETLESYPEQYLLKDGRIVSNDEMKGAYEILWDIFGGSINDKGFKVLDTHIGMIYGDSINLERQAEIYKRLEAKGFAATNLVLGVGSFTYQFKSRDSLGFAMKATWCQVNGKGREIFKNPKTDSGVKKSLKGLIKVDKSNGTLRAVDQVYATIEAMGELKTVFYNGKIVKDFTLAEVRANVDASIK